MDSRVQDMYQTLLLELWNHIKTTDCTNEQNINHMKSMFSCLMDSLYRRIPDNGSILYAIYQHNVHQLFSFISYIRDIHNEFGYRTLSYAFLSVCYDYEPILCQTFIKHMVTIENNVFSTGSWRDICGLCNYLKKHYGFEHPLINYCIQLMNETLHEDLKQYNENGTIKTNVAKWIPRETSKVSKWLYERLFFHWGKHYTCYIPNIEHKSYIRAIFKCKTKYRQLVSKLTRLCHPIEHKLCSNNIGQIDPCKISCNAFLKYWDVIFNQTNTYQERQPYFQNHICAFNCNHYISTLFNNPLFNYKIRLPNLYFPEHIDKYVKRGIEIIIYKQEHNTSLISSKMAMEIELLNHKMFHLYDNWSQGNTLRENCLPVINVQCSSFRDPHLFKAIARAFFLVQKSNIKRIFFSCHSPIWINVESCTSFMSILEKIYSCLHNEIWINPSLGNIIYTLGVDHPFTLYILSPYGQCSIYGEEETYDNLNLILQSKRYSIFSS